MTIRTYNIRLVERYVLEGVCFTMNEEQRLGQQGNTHIKKNQQQQPKKDYSQYFDFSKAKIISEDDNKKVMRINGRDITIHEQPDYKQGKRRGKETTQVIRPEHVIPPELTQLGAGKKFLIRTYGCQMNTHDSENMAGLLTEMGFESTDVTEEADVILLNTCAIRENAENKVFGEIGHLKPLKLEKPELIIGVCGCMSQEESVVNRILQKHQHIDLVFGTHNIHRLPHLLRDAIFGKEMVVEVWSRKATLLKTCLVSVKVRHKPGLTSCMAVISSAHIVLFLIRVEKNVAVCQRTLSLKFVTLLAKATKKSLCLDKM